jgi:AcrR family transcriptional regulator
MAKRTEKREAAQTPAPRTGSSIRDKLVPTRERILDAAVNVLENSGLRKLAQPHIAKAAGVAQGHLTYYFPKKSDLVTALVGRFIDLLKEDLPHNLREGALERVDIMRARALRMAFRVVKNRARMRMLLGLVVTAEDDPAVRETMAEHLELVQSLVARFLGKPATDPDAEIVLAMLWGVGLQNLILEGRRSDAQTDRVLARAEEWLAHIPPPRAPKKKPG